MLDRTQAPDFQTIKRLNFLRVQKQLLDNQIPLYTLCAGEQAVVRIEWIFEAGNYYNEKDGQAPLTSQMLLEGTKHKDATQIYAAIDQYGAFADAFCKLDTIEMVLHCPTRFVEKVLPIIAEVLLEPTFPEAELEKFKHNLSQELQINLQKPSFLAGYFIKKAIFGEEHPYGKTLELKHIEQINRDDLISFYEKRIYRRPAAILVSGKFDEATLQVINRYFGQFVALTNPPFPNNFPIRSQTGSFFIEKLDSLQNAIKISKLIPPHSDNERYRLIVANTILGGYFGSRLMQNIREEKGYTYGIDSSLQIFEKATLISIDTEVNAEFTQNTLQEIYKEIDLLQNEKVSEKELQKVKNYLIGSLAAGLTTPFAQMDLFKKIYFYHLSYEFYENYIEQINAVNADDILITMQKHYRKEDMIEVVVGKPSK